VTFPHLDDSGNAKIVDVSGKQITTRTAVASAEVRVSAEVIDALRSEAIPKGDALAVARIAGLQAAKRTWELIPLAHPLALEAAQVDLAVLDDRVEIRASVSTDHKTGVEMEALTAASVAALALIDMVKSLDRSAHIGYVRLEEKHGGRSGSWYRETP
jgi:cyclic pyranopterin phosphate synthase